MEKVDLSELDTSKQDWASEFIANADSVSSFILPATIPAKSLSEYVSGLSNTDGGYILVGAYSESNLGSGYQTVSPETIKDTRELLVNALYNVEEHSPRGQRVYLLKVGKSDSIAFADGRAFVIKAGTPTLMPEKTLLNSLGLGVDSELINMLSKQITSQSLKIDEQSNHIHGLTHDIQEKAKLKNQLSGLIVGGVIGAIIGWVLSILLNKLFGLS